MRRLRIAHISTVHTLFDTRIYQKEAMSGSRAGHDVHIIAISPDRDEIEAEAQQLDLLPLRKSRNRFLRMTVLTVVAWLKALRRNADIYQFHDPELMPLAVVLAMCGKVVIYDAHENVVEDILTKTYLPFWVRRCLAFVYDRFERWSASKLSGVIAATTHIAGRFDHCERVVEILNYPTAIVPSCQTSQFAGYREHKHIVYGGVISKERGILELLDAMASEKWPKGERLKLAGRVSASLLDELRRHPSWKFVEYYGELRQAEYFDLLLGCKVGVCTFRSGPNHDASSPNKIFEYMACGLPIVASNFSLWRTVIESTGTGICVNPANPIEIATAVAGICNDVDCAQQMSRAGIVAAKKKYNWKTQEVKLLEFYLKCAA